MLRRIIGLVLVAVAVSATASAQSMKLPEIEFGRYHALVIGNNDYQHLRNLTTAVGDADAVATLLEEKYGFQVTKLTNATRLDITGAFNRLRQTLTEKDNLLVYYAGHGVLDEEAGAGYWQPVDARPDDDSNWFSNTRLTNYLKAMSAKHVMVVADSCYSGNLTRVATSTVRSGAERTAWMNRMNGKRSRTALTSGGLEPVLDQGGRGHSVFASAFLTALDETPDVLFGEELFDQVKGVVVANADQTPEYSDIRYTGHEKGDFLFVPLDIRISVTVQTPPTGQADREALFWQSIQNSDNPAMFEAYLSQFPEGMFAEIARLKIEAARKAEEKQTALVVPPKPKIEIDPIEAEYVAVKNANVRAEPTVRSAKVTTLKRGTTVQVAGKVKGGNWYLVERDDKPLGYVYGELLMEPEAAKLALAVPPRPQVPSTTQPAVGVYPSARQPGEVFRDCADCPEMVVIPAGSFTMGSAESDSTGYPDERPQHRVTIPRAFALGKYEVTRLEFAAFVRDTGHDPRGCRVYTGKKWENQSSRSWRDPNFNQSERDPVVCVNWDDAKKYVRWLTRKTGQDYRLPSESEWEYAARAETTTAHYWGEAADRACGYGNVHDRTSNSENGFTWKHHDCRDGYAKTAPVGSFRANYFGLHDVLGNAREWVEDCWNDGYSGAPSNGRAWTTGECSRRLLRGGSWLNGPRNLRVGIRFGNTPGNRISVLGFRIARTLP